MMMAYPRHGLHVRSHIRSLCVALAVLGVLGLAWFALLLLTQLVVWLVAGVVTAAGDYPYAALWCGVTALAAWGAWALRGEG